MKYLKKICCRKVADRVHNNEGVRVGVSTGKDPKAGKSDGVATRNWIWAFIVKMVIRETFRWSIQNWPFICEKASNVFEVIMELLK